MKRKNTKKQNQSKQIIKFKGVSLDASKIGNAFIIKYYLDQDNEDVQKIFTFLKRKYILAKDRKNKQKEYQQELYHFNKLKKLYKKIEKLSNPKKCENFFTQAENTNYKSAIKYFMDKRILFLKNKINEIREKLYLVNDFDTFLYIALKDIGVEAILPKEKTFKGIQLYQEFKKEIE